MQRQTALRVSLQNLSWRESVYARVSLQNISWRESVYARSQQQRQEQSVCQSVSIVSIQLIL